MRQNSQISLNNLSPFGSAMASRGYSSGAYRYGFNGKEKDEESFNDAYDFGARIYDGRLGRFMSLDPRMSEYSWQSPYVYFMNCPVKIIDYLGEGEHYDNDGKKLGSDGKTDDFSYKTTQGCIDAHTKTELIDNKEVRTTNWEAVIADSRTEKLCVSNTELGVLANTIYNESGGSNEESMGIGNCIANQKDESNGKYNFTEVQDGKQGGSIYGYQKDITNFSNNRGSLAAAINAVSKERVDNAFGATHWDGDDFFSKGSKHKKFYEYKIIIIKKEYIVQLYIEAYKKWGGPTHSYNHKTVDNINNDFYNLTKFTDYGFLFSSGFWFVKPKLTFNYYYGNKSKPQQLVSVAMYGRTIFWKKN